VVSLALAKKSFELSYYRNAKDSKSSGVIEIDERYEVYPAGYHFKKAMFTFVLSPLTEAKKDNLIRAYFFSAVSVVEMKEWLTCLKSALDQMKGLPKPRYLSEKRTFASKIILTGYLSKRGGSNSGWKKRWIILRKEPPEPWSTLPENRPFTLSYYNSKDDQDPIGVIFLTDRHSVAYNEHPSDKQFLLRSIESNEDSSIRTYYFASDSQEDIENWVRGLEGAIKGDIDYFRENLDNQISKTVEVKMEEKAFSKTYFLPAGLVLRIDHDKKLIQVIADETYEGFSFQFERGNSK